MLRVLSKIDERICKQILMEKYKFISLLSEIYLKDSIDIELKQLIVRASNNLVDNNSA